MVCNKVTLSQAIRRLNDKDFHGMLCITDEDGIDSPIEAMELVNSFPDDFPTIEMAVDPLDKNRGPIRKRGKGKLNKY